MSSVVLHLIKSFSTNRAAGLLAFGVGDVVLEVDTFPFRDQSKHEN